MALGLADRVAVQAITDLADAYAERVVDDLLSMESAEQLTRALSGCFLGFLADAVAVANSLQT